MSKKSKKAASTGKAKAKDLKISKETIQSLSDDELGKVQGGIAPTLFLPCLPIITRNLCPRPPGPIPPLGGAK